MKSKIAMLLIITLLVSITLGVVLYKPDIEEASIEDIQTIQGIGPVLSLRIVDYIGEAETFDIEDLLNVEGIGEERLKDIRRSYK